MKFEKNLIELVIGIKFRQNFGLCDNLGQIIDKILYKKKSFFNPEVFPYTNSSQNQSILYNDKNNDRLTITSSDIILDIGSLIQNSFFKIEQFDEIIRQYKSSIIDCINDIYDVHDIMRIGVLKKLNFNGDEFDSKILTPGIVDSMDGINEFSLSFKHQTPTEKAKTHKDISDFRNATYIIKKLPDKNNLLVTLDYQEYYSPVLEDLYDIDYDEFMKFSTDYYLNNFSSWIEKKIVGDKK